MVPIGVFPKTLHYANYQAHCPHLLTPFQLSIPLYVFLLLFLLLMNALTKIRSFFILIVDTLIPLVRRSLVLIKDSLYLLNFQYFYLLRATNSTPFLTILYFLLQFHPILKVHPFHLIHSSKLILTEFSFHHPLHLLPQFLFLF